MIEWLSHPGLLLMLGAVVLSWTKGSLRSALIIAVPLLALYLVWQIPDGPVWRIGFLDYSLSPLQGDKLSRLFATIFALMAAGGGLFALNQPSRLEVPAAFVYAGAAIGVAFAGDLLTVFVFWEMMAIGSTLVLWSTGNDRSYAAARRYVMIHMLGGVLLLAGIAGHIASTGSAEFSAMSLQSPAQWLMLAGFLINAGGPPFSSWLPDAYPEASWSGTVFLSAFTTKTAVYVLIRGFPGTELLIYLGLFMVFYGIIYALLENDMRRILAYSIVNQVGFMITGIGIGTEMALNGAAAHAFTHIIYKGLLLMSAGAVLYATGKRKCSELGGLFHTMPLTTICGSIGALAISSFPLTSGFVSKSMVSQAAADQHLVWIWMLLTAASAGVFLHAGIKFPWFVFFQKDSGLRPPEPPLNMRWAMLLFAALCIGLGVWAEPLYAMLPYSVTYEPYTLAHVLTQLQLLLFAGLAFFLMLPFLKRTLTITLDSDWVYRRLLPAAAAMVGSGLAHGRRVGQRIGSPIGRRLLDPLLRQHRPHGSLASAWPTGSMALWMLLMLLGYLVLYYS